MNGTAPPASSQVKVDTSKYMIYYTKFVGDSCSPIPQTNDSEKRSSSRNTHTHTLIISLFDLKITMLDGQIIVATAAIKIPKSSKKSGGVGSERVAKRWSVKCR